jgi:hypothetical protein
MSEDILRKVRGLVAKANSTPFEQEREVFMAKADELMEKYAIDQALLAMEEDTQARYVIRKDVDISWWSEMRDMDKEVRSRIYWLWSYCVEFCRCYSSTSTWNYKAKTAAVYGMPADLDYMNLLFTDLFLQMSATLRPKYDPNLTMGHNVYNAKNAGMKYVDIAIWMGMPELVEPNGTGGLKTRDGGKMKHAYQRHLNEHHPGEKRITMHPTTWAMSFMDGYVTTIHERFRKMRSMRDVPSDANSMALVVRDIREQAREAMFDDFPNLRPHPADCQCKHCVAARKPVKYSASRARAGRKLDWSARTQGGQAGESARIVTMGEKLRGDKKGELPS